MFSTASDMEASSGDPTPISELLSETKLDPDRAMVGQIYALLWELISTIRIKPGQLLSEKEVAEALQASKTPVREAMIRLEEAGLVEIVPKSGTYVTPIRIDRYIEACFTRLQLEIGAVRQAASRNHDFQQLIQLKTILQKQEDALAAKSYEAFFQLDEALHRAFFEMAGVPGVWNVLRKSQSDVYRIRHLKRVHNIRRGSEVIKQHKAIVKAIREGDQDEAEAALVRHIGSLTTEIDELSSYPELLDYIEKLNANEKQTRTQRRAAKRDD